MKNNLELYNGEIDFPETMKIKEVAEALNVNEITVRRAIQAIAPDIIQNGKKTLLNESMVTAIKMRIEKNHPDKIVAVEKTALEKKLIVQQAIMILNDEISQLKSENEILKIELDESKKWYSVKRVKSLGYVNWVSARKMWSPLKKWSIQNDYQIVSIFDANYGEVKTYHADAWEAVYGVKL